MTKKKAKKKELATQKSDKNWWMPCSLGQNLVDHSTADVGQTEVAALETVGQPRVVDAK